MAARGWTNEKRDPKLEGKSPVKAAIVAVVLAEPGQKAYKIAKLVNARMGVTWRVDPKQMYTPLKQLERDGLLRSETVPSDNPPGWERVYYPTEKTENAWQALLATPPVPSIGRADIVARLAFSREQDAPEILRALEAHSRYLLSLAEDDAETETPAAPWLERVVSYRRNAIDKGRQAEIAWVAETTADIQAYLSKRRLQ